jgi:hypothetical protein
MCTYKFTYNLNFLGVNFLRRAEEEKKKKRVSFEGAKPLRKRP